MDGSVRGRESPRWFAFCATAYVWFDVFVYSATALVLGPHFFPGDSQAAVNAAALASIAVSLVFRPAGAVLGGWLADRLGRRPVMVWSLVAGSATALMAVVPTAESVGALATVMVLLLRALQGMATGAMWPGLHLLVVELPPDAHRGASSAIAQAGVPAGLLLSSGVVALVTQILPAQDYAAWGWRLPYLVPLLLVHMAWWSWHTGRPAESPAYQRGREAGVLCGHPLRHAVRTGPRRLVGGAVVVFGGQVIALLVVGAFVPSFAWDAGQAVPAGQGASIAAVSAVQDALSRTDSLLSVTFGAAVWLASAVVTGAAADRLGATRVLVAAHAYTALVLFPFLLLASSPSVLNVYAGLALIGVGLGGTTGARGLWLAGLYAPQVRGVSVGLVSGVGVFAAGILAPTVAAAVRGTAAELPVVCVLALLSLAAAVVALLRLRGVGEPWEPQGPCPLCSTSDSGRLRPSRSARPS